MRTTIAALLVSLAACGGDGGLSLTEPHQIDLAACVEAPADLTGRWIVGEWGCEIRAIDQGGPNCDPEALPLRDGVDVVVVRVAADEYTVTVGNETFAAYGGPTHISGVLAAGGYFGLLGCANGDTLASFVDRPGGSAFVAYADRR